MKLLVILLLFHTTFLMINGQISSITNTHHETYIVHVQKPKNTKPLRSTDLLSWYMSFLPTKTLASGEARIVYAYQTAITGFAARLTSAEVKAMEMKEGFIHATKDRMLYLHTTHINDYLGLNQGTCLQKDTNLGKGLIIGMLDTGVLPNHPSFNDSGLPHPPTKWKGHCDFKPSTCNNKLIGARSFKSGNKDLPYDPIGHGTHTASIAAGGFVKDAQVLGNAKGTASGIAPNCHLAIYKVCHSRVCGSSDVLAGIDQAMADGVDVISLSFGGGAVPFYNDAVAIGALAAVEKGIIVTSSAGNSGPTKGTIENDSPWLITVGASTMDRMIRARVKLGNGEELPGESAYHPSGFTSGFLPIIYPGRHGGSRAKACSDGSLSRINVKGMVVLCHNSGENHTVEKGIVVQRAGGVAMILINEEDQDMTTRAAAHVLPAAHVSYSDGRRILAYALSKTNPTATIVFDGTLYGISPAPSVASFSSRGPSSVNEGVLKPDIIAPGVNILAAWPSPVGPLSLESPVNSTITSMAFNIVSGTSLSSPVIAGVATLLKTTHPNWSPAAIKSAIMTTADTLDRDGLPISDLYSMGAGHINLAKANDPGLVYDIIKDDYIPYLCGLGYTDKQVSAVARRIIECASIDPINAEELNYPSVTVALGSKAKKTITRLVTNVGESESLYTVQIKKPEGVEVSVYPKKLGFSEMNQTLSFSLYFSSGDVGAMKGDVSEGYLRWVSNKHIVRSPILVTFT
ncbi:Tripeptidyl-peptidase II protein [Dioscorea alata]|uniref:Tripeptidyl-peptidase II protein n=1 Tax=Dioscorea alata TaxID=55571 RepID=A0ACB7WRC3_DIOAL|nr:Tripeptidyl-peptidase II protein [Dioscorea alata]